MNRYARAPEVRSLADAIAIVKSVVAEMKPWPEKIEVGDPEEFTGRIIFKDDEDYALPRQVHAKLRQVASEIRTALLLMNVLPRMPDLMIVMGDAATWIWDDRIACIPGKKPGPWE